MPNQNVPKSTIVGRDTTLRWSCRAGDFLLWLRYPSLFAANVEMVDYWEMRDRNSVIITNRYDDIPGWFALHPLEVCDSFLPLMRAKLEAGYDPGGPVVGPNIWRLRSGDRVVWIGCDRPGHKAPGGILAILEIDSCSLVLGETIGDGLQEFLQFGAPSTEKPCAADAARCRAGLTAVRAIGMPSSWGEEWLIG